MYFYNVKRRFRSLWWSGIFNFARILPCFFLVSFAWENGNNLFYDVIQNLARLSIILVTLFDNLLGPAGWLISMLCFSASVIKDYFVLIIVIIMNLIVHMQLDVLILEPSVKYRLDVRFSLKILVRSSVDSGTPTPCWASYFLCVCVEWTFSVSSVYSWTI